jgi:tetratricopeptide (TPR) repeat protein
MNQPNGGPPRDDASAAEAGASRGASASRVAAPADANDPTSRLIRQMERLVEQTSQPAMRVPLLHRLAKTWEERAGDPDRALAVLGEALELNPRDRKTAAELERIAERTGGWDTVARLWARLAEQPPDPGARVELLAGLARVRGERLGDEAGALACWEQVLADDPRHPDALRAVTSAYRAAGRDEELADTLPRLVAATERPRDRAELLIELGTLRERLGSRLEALGAFENAGFLLGDDLRVLEALARIFLDLERIEDVVSVLERLATLDPSRQAELRLDAAGLCSQRLDDTPRAVRLLEALLRSEPGNQDALDRLAALYVEAADWPSLASVYERQLEATRDEGERARLCRQLAVLSEDAARDPQRAATWWALLLGHDPRNPEAFAALRRIHREAGRWSELVGVLSTRAEQPDLPEDERTELQLEVARILRWQLDDAEGGVQVLEGVLAGHPRHEKALALLEELLRGAGDPQRLVGLLDRKLAQADTPEKRSVIHLERAEALREAGQTSEAIAAWRAALAETPGMVTALRHLTAALAAEGRGEEVVRELRAALDARYPGDDTAIGRRVIADPALRADLLCELATAYQAVEDGDGVADALERALELRPDHPVAAEALADVFIAQSRWPEALPLLEILLPTLDTEEQPQRAAGFLKKIGRVVDELRQYERAASFYGMADALVADDPDTVAGVARLARRLGRADEAARRYEQLLRLTGDAGVSGGDGVEARLVLMDRTLATGDVDAAAGHAEAVLAVVPDEPRALEVLIAVADRRDDWAVAVGLRRRLTAVLERRGGEPLALLKLRMELGTLLEERLDDPEGALAVFERAAEEAPESRGPLLKVLEIQSALDRPEAALLTLALLVQHARRPEERARYHFTAASFLTSLGREAEAIEELIRTVENDLERIDVLRDAEERLNARGDVPGVARALERVMAAARDRGARHLARNLARRLGEHHLRRREDLAAAAAAYREACELDPEDRRLRERLIEILAAAGRLLEAIDEQRALIARQPEQAAAWRALLDLFERAGESCGAHAALGVLVFTEQATPVEKERHEAAPQPRLGELPGRLARDHWLEQAAGGLHRTPIGLVMRVLHDHLGDALEARTLRDEGLRKGDELDPAQDLLLLRTLRSAAAALGVKAPPVYFDQQAKGFRVLPIAPPAFAIGTGLLKGRRENELAFVAGKGLVYLQPEFALAAQFSPGTLRALVGCARAWADPDHTAPPVDTTKRRRMEAVVKTLERRVTGADAELLHEAVARCDESGVAEWLAAVARTANHVGLLCCGDVPTASHLCARPITSWEPPLEGVDAILDLAHFSVSERYLELRRKLRGPDES